MLQLAVELILAPALVALVSLTERRWGPQAGGVLGAFPAIAGPLLLIIATRSGGSAAARAADGTLSGLLTLAAFTAVYARAARGHHPLRALGSGWLAAGLCGVAVVPELRDAPAPLAITTALGSLGLAYLTLPSSDGSRPEEPGSTSQLSPGTERILPRMASAVLLLALLALAAQALGPFIGGILAGLPVLASVLAGFTHTRLGATAAVALLRGMLVGMGAFVSFCALVALTVVRFGVPGAFLTALLAAISAEVAAQKLLRRARTR